MTKRGHTVYLYAAAKNDADCEEVIPCTPQPRSSKVTEPEWTQEYFAKMNARVIKELRKRLEPQDFICLITGYPQQPIAEAFPAHTAVEFGVGYLGTFAKFRVFESYAWMHAVYGHQQGAMDANGNFYDAVIPNYFEPEQFPLGKGKGGYLLYMGRMIERKGLQVVADVAERSGLPIVWAGQGTPPPCGEHVGVVGVKRRAELMGEAVALLAPTLYVEPFGGVAVEAQMCGTPVITTDWGAFTETVEQGVTGYRCHTLAEFVAATRAAKFLSRRWIRTRAVKLYSTEVVAKQYEDYFVRLLGLFGYGWYT